jgi:hypothetical protein
MMHQNHKRPRVPSIQQRHKLFTNQKHKEHELTLGHGLTLAFHGSILKSLHMLYSFSVYFRLSGIGIKTVERGLQIRPFF